MKIYTGKYSIYNVICYAIARKSTAESSNNFQLVASSAQFNK